MTPVFTKSYPAAAAVNGNRFVVLGASGASQAAGVGAPIVGISDRLGADAGAMIDVDHLGRGEIRLGGAVAAGDPLTADAQGRAIKAEVTASTVVWVGGIALAAGTADDIVSALIIQATLSKAAA